MNFLNYTEVVTDHYARLWGNPIAAARLTVGPVHQLPGFRVLVFRRSEEMVAFATCGMSASTDDAPVELHLLASPTFSEARESIVEALTAVAHYHRTGVRLGLGHTVNLGRPWVAGSSCTHGLISLPYLDGPALEWLPDRSARFLWLIPVTLAEVRYKSQNGLEALEQRFEQAGFDFLDPRRRSVV